MNFKRLQLKCFFVGLLLLATTVVNAQQYSLATLQTVFLYSSMKYMEWPDEQSGNEFIINVVGDDEVYNELLKLAKAKQIKGRSIVVNKVQSVEGSPSCHILFFGNATAHNVSKIKANFGKSPVLVITTKDGLLEKGSDLNLILKGEKLIFQINEGSVTSKGIKVSSTLINMAQKA